MYESQIPAAFLVTREISFISNGSAHHQYQFQKASEAFLSVSLLPVKGSLAGAVFIKKKTDGKPSAKKEKMRFMNIVMDIWIL